MNQLEEVQISACQEDIIYDYFDLIKKVAREKGVKDGRWYNEDECGFGKKLELRYSYLLAT